MRAAWIVYAAAGAALGFSAIWFGLPLLGAVEHGVGLRVTIAALAGLAVATGFGLVARGRAVAAIADGALMGEASPALLAHRARKQRAKIVGLLGAVLGGGVSYGLFHVLYAQANEDRYEWDLLEVGGVELGLSVGAGLALGFIAWAITKPGLFTEDEEAHDAPTGAPVSDAELEATVGQVRAFQRRTMLARFGSVAATMTTLLGAIVGLSWLTEEANLDLGGQPYLFAFAAAIGVGVLFHKIVAPKTTLDDLERADGPTPASLNTADAASLDFAGLLDGASRLDVSRQSSLLRWLGLDAGRSYMVAADSVALADAAETVTPLMRMLPAWAQRYRVEVRDDDRVVLALDGGWLGITSPRVTVRTPDGPLGIVDARWIGRRYRLLGADGTVKLELVGSFWTRRALAVRRGGETVGHLTITRASHGVDALVSGQHHQLELDLPVDATPEERRLLIAATLVVDRRHF